jgi:hypothetical protein
MTPGTSSSSSTRSPITIALPSSIGLKAAYEPSAKTGLDGHALDRDLQVGAGHADPIDATEHLSAGPAKSLAHRRPVDRSGLHGRRHDVRRRLLAGRQSARRQCNADAYQQY